MTADREALLYATGYADGRRHLIERLQEQQQTLSGQVKSLKRAAAKQSLLVELLRGDPT